MKISGCVMSRDKVIAEVLDGSIVSMDESLVPFRLRSGDIEGWLCSRAIDSHRTNSRLLKRALRLAAADDAEVALKVNACTITDTYWFRPQGSELKYTDVRFTFNHFDKLALYGDPDSFNHPESRTPELTNIGSFEKCWRLIDGEWWMFKQGSSLERFSELFAYKLGSELGFDMAEYALEDHFIKSRDFTRGASVNYEPAEGLVGKDENYVLNFDTFYMLSPDCAEQYLAILYMDALVFNMDRHTQNYGILRDVDSGRVLGMAPNFDNNIALISRGYPGNTSRDKDRLIGDFISLLAENSRARELFAKISQKAVTEELVGKIIDSIIIEADRENVIRFVTNGASRLG